MLTQEVIIQTKLLCENNPMYLMRVVNDFIDERPAKIGEIKHFGDYYYVTVDLLSHPTNNEIPWTEEQWFDRFRINRGRSAIISPEELQALAKKVMSESMEEHLAETDKINQNIMDSLLDANNESINECGEAFCMCVHKGAGNKQPLSEEKMIRRVQRNHENNNSNNK